MDAGPKRKKSLSRGTEKKIILISIRPVLIKNPAFFSC